MGKISLYNCLNYQREEPGSNPGDQLFFIYPFYIQLFPSRHGHGLVYVRIMGHLMWATRVREVGIFCTDL